MEQNEGEYVKMGGKKKEKRDILDIFSDFATEFLYTVKYVHLYDML